MFERTTTRQLLAGTILVVAAAAAPLIATPTTAMDAQGNAVAGPADTTARVATRVPVRTATGDHAQRGGIASTAQSAAAADAAASAALLAAAAGTAQDAPAGPPLAGAGLDNGATYLGGGTLFTFGSATGWYFTPNEDLPVSELGFFDEDADGLGESHDVGLYLADGTEVATAVIPAGTAATLRGSTRFVPIATVTLSAGVQYYLTANNYVTDRYVFGAEAIGFDPRLTWDGFSQGDSDDIASAHTNFGGIPGNLGPNIGIGLVGPLVKQNAVTFVGGGSTNTFGSATGWYFTANEDLLVSELGYWDENSDGLGGPHDVGLYLVDGTQVATATVPAGTAALLRGTTRFVPIEPVELPAGTSYYLTANNNTTDAFVFGSTALAFDPRVTWDGFSQGESNDIDSPHSNNGGLPGNLGPNMGLATPCEPGTGARYVEGGTFFTFASATGWYFTPNEDLLVNELGFLDRDGDGLGEAHDVGLFQADGTPVASVTIPAGTAATLKDGNRVVGIPEVTLNAGVQYYLTANNYETDQYVFGDGAIAFDPRLTWDGFGQGESDDINSPHSNLGGLPGNLGPTLGICGDAPLPCPADLDFDGDVDFSDLLVVLAAFGGGAAGDIDGDGDTDFNDLVSLLAAWGPCP